MRIVVGTDFSPSARQAADFAATLATRAASEVVLVHALERPRGAPLPGTARTRMEDLPRASAAARARLDAEASRLRASGAVVETRLAAEPPAPALLAAVAEARADLLVVGIVGQRQPGRLVLGSTTEQVAQASPVPVLGLRFEEAFHPWLHGREPLRVLHADDGSAGAAAALAWANRLSLVGPLDLTVARVLPRRDRSSWWPFARPREAAVERELVERVERLSRAASVHVMVRRSTGPVAGELLALAAEARVGLILAGSQQRTGLRRIWSTSVARSLLAGSLVSVLMVPGGPAAREARAGDEREAAGLPG